MFNKKNSKSNPAIHKNIICHDQASRISRNENLVKYLTINVYVIINMLKKKSYASIST